LQLIAVIGLTSLAVAGDINGKILGWSHKSSPQQPAVVWLEGIQGKPSAHESVMAQHGGQFVPPFLIVVAGQTVTMPNEDDVAHNVYSRSVAKPFDLGYYAKGELKTVTFDRPGLVEVFCLIHSFMRAKILVVPNPYYATIEEDGTFRIRDVPAGTFTLSSWAEGMTSFSQEVTVPQEAKAVKVTLSWPSAPSRKK
jgi:plastocyanin